MDVPLHHSSAVAPDLGSRQIWWRADGGDMQSTSVLFLEAVLFSLVRLILLVLGFLLLGFVLRVCVAIKFSAKVDIDLFVHT